MWKISTFICKNHDHPNGLQKKKNARHDRIKRNISSRKRGAKRRQRNGEERRQMNRRGRNTHTRRGNWDGPFSRPSQTTTIATPCYAKKMCWIGRRCLGDGSSSLGPTRVWERKRNTHSEHREWIKTSLSPGALLCLRRRVRALFFIFRLFLHSRIHLFDREKNKEKPMNEPLDERRKTTADEYTRCKET